MQNEMIFIVRVKIPKGNEQAQNDAIFAVKPQGFEVRWPLLNRCWPIDIEGYTWVPLFPYSIKDALVNSIDREYETRNQLNMIKEKIKTIF